MKYKQGLYVKLQADCNGYARVYNNITNECTSQIFKLGYVYLDGYIGVVIADITCNKCNSIYHDITIADYGRNIMVEVGILIEI